MSNVDRERMDKALDGMSRAVAQRAAAEGHVYIARLLLRDWIAAMRLDSPQERELALIRVKLETEQYLDSLPSREEAGRGTAGNTPAESAPVGGEAGAADSAAGVA